MPALPGDPGAKVYVRRKPRVRRKPAPAPSSEALKGRAFGSRPARPVPVSNDTPRRRPTGRPVSNDTGGDTKGDVHAGKSFKRTKPYRGAVVAAYSAHSVHDRRRLAREAAKRIDAGKGTEADRAIVHAHVSRVAGKRKVARATAAFNALTGTTADDVAFPKPAGGDFKVKRKASITRDLKNLGRVITGIGAASSKGYASVHAPKVLVNAPKDIADIAVTTPSSIAKLASDAVHHPERVPGELAAPYVELAKHPAKFIEERPVSAALMLAPGARLPGRAAGRVARVAGKQTLERPAATFPGTNLRETRTGSRDIVVRAVQKRRDAKRGAPVMSEKDVGKRVDEFFDSARPQREREIQSLLNDRPDMPLATARKVAAKRVRRRFAEEFGGEVHPTKEAAQAASESLPFEGKVVKLRKGEHTVVPKFAADRLGHHERVGSAKATGSKVLRTSRRAFTKAVLPLSPKWLSGQAVESAFRSLTVGAGPVSFARGVRSLRALDPETRAQVMARAVPGGQSRVPREILSEGGGKTLADEYAGTSLARVAKAATAMGKAPGVKQLRGLNDAVTGFVFDTLNGRIIEATTQKAMLGRALKESPLMERRVVGLSSSAIREAAEGLRGTENQVALAREVRKAYGKYSAFSPGAREAILHWTPFAPWFGNVTRFLLHTLPVEHPVMAALVADVDAATEEWRKAAGLSFHGGKRKPGYLLGSAPHGKEGQMVRVGRYLPFAPGDTGIETLVDLILPQFSGAYAAAQGRDPVTGEPAHGKFGPDAHEGEKALAAAVQLVESMVPGVGVTHRVVERGPNQVFNPLAPTRKPKPRKVRRKGGGIGLEPVDIGLGVPKDKRPALTGVDIGLP